MHASPPPAIGRPLHLPFPFQLDLQGYILLGYRLPTARLRPLVPASLPLWTEETPGGSFGWFSIYMGLNVLKGLGRLPAPPLRFYQINYRIYLAPAEGRRFFLVRSLVSDPLSARLARSLLGFPAHFERIRVARADAEGGQPCVHVRADGELEVLVQGEAELPAVPGFASPLEARAFLADVPTALYALGERRLGQLVSPHPPVRATGGRALRITLPWLVKKGVLTAEAAAAPEAIYMQERAPFPLLL